MKANRTQEVNVTKVRWLDAHDTNWQKAWIFAKSNLNKAILLPHCGRDAFNWQDDRSRQSVTDLPDQWMKIESHMGRCWLDDWTSQWGLIQSVLRFSGRLLQVGDEWVLEQIRWVYSPTISDFHVSKLSWWRYLINTRWLIRMCIVPQSMWTRGFMKMLTW